MKKILNNNIKNMEPSIINIFDLYQLLNPQIVEVYECFIIDNKNELSEEKINFVRVMKHNRNSRNYYEASFNEIRVNDLIDGNVDSPLLVNIGLNILSSWMTNLYNNYPDSEFIFIISENNGYVTIRFHKKRQDEISWLSEDLEGYKSEAVGYFYSYIK